MTRRKTATRIAKAFLAIGFAASAAVLGAQLTWASDHKDAPSLAGDVDVDIGDVFAFVHPSTPGRMVLAMTVRPEAPQGATFPVFVEYVFQITGYDPATGLPDPTLASAQVSCRFQAPSATSQVVLCSANGFSGYNKIGDEDGGSASDAPLRVFAGLRADPAFGDIAKLDQTLTNKALAFDASAGTNAFAGKNVLAIVVEIDVAKVVFLDDGSAGAVTRPVLAVSGSTQRLQ